MEDHTGLTGLPRAHTTPEIYGDPFAAAAQGWSGGPLPLEISPHSAPGCLPGDPYGERDDATRGVSLLPSSFGFDVGANAQFGKAKISTAGGKDSSTALERFADADALPVTPRGSFFSFMATTFFVSAGIAPFVLANLLLDFLVVDLMASVSKVRRLKYSIKADVTGGSFAGNADYGPLAPSYEPCTLKIKLYDHGAEAAIEFRRCGGDSVTFNDVFRRAQKYLEHHTAPRGATVRA